MVVVVVVVGDFFLCWTVLLGFILLCFSRFVILFLRLLHFVSVRFVVWLNIFSIMATQAAYEQKTCVLREAGCWLVAELTILVIATSAIPHRLLWIHSYAVVGLIDWLMVWNPKIRCTPKNKKINVVVRQTETKLPLLIFSFQVSSEKVTWWLKKILIYWIIIKSYALVL